MVFTEFIEFAEQQFGLETVDQMLEASSSGGAYTSVGTYDHQELVAMLIKLSQLTQTEIKDLLMAYGKHLFSYLVHSYPAVLGDSSTAFDLLSHIDDQIHVEVRKLYPDSELPEFSHEFISDSHMRLTYRSERGLADLAEGLLQGCFEHYNESVEVQKKDLSNGDSTVVQFDLTKTQ